MMQRKVILYISMSLDGYLATKDDDLSWLSVVERTGEDYGYETFNSTVDTYIVGRKTYEVVLNLTGGVFPAAAQHNCYVITRQELPPAKGVTFYQGNVQELIADLKRKPGKHIYCDGGAQIVQLLLKDDLIDEFIISIIPVILGDGKRLFLGDIHQQSLELVSSKQYDSGLVQLHYQRAE